MNKTAPTGRRGGGRHVSPALIDADYTKKGYALGGETERKRVYYGTPNGPIGPMGVAFALHRCLWIEDAAMSAQVFGMVLSEQVLALETSTPDSLTPDHLRGWVQASRPVALPDPRHAALVLEAIQRLAQQHDLQAEAIAALGRTWRRPSDLLTFLLRAGSRPERLGPDFDAIDPLFRSRAPLSDQRQQDLVLELGDLFTGSVGRSRIIWLYGPPYSGKRRILSHLIGEKLVDNDFIELREGERLELFARVSCVSIEQIVIDIATFLHIETPTDRPLAEQLDWLLEKIEEVASERKAAYILCDVPSVSDPLQNLVRNESLQRLIAAIFGDGNGNRILLTSTDPVRHNPYLPSGIFHEKSPPQPTVGEFVAKHGLSLDERVVTDKPLDGPLAGLLGTVLDQLGDGKKSAIPTITAALDEWNNMPDDTRSLDWSERHDLLSLAKIVYDQVRDPEQRQIFRFMATSVDGLRLSSIFFLTRANSNDEQGEIRRRVEKLINALPLLCVRVEDTGPWSSEDPPEKTGLEPLIDFFPPYRRVFEHMLLEQEAALFRKENWRLALLARDKTRWLRINTNVHHYTRPSDAIRIVQGLLRALVALDPDLLNQRVEDPEGRERHAISRGAFERFVLSGEFNTPRDAADAFRFLFFEIFRDDIDRGHRLSLEYHRDDVRLSVLLAFCSVGWPVYIEDHSLSPAEDRSPSSGFRSWHIVKGILAADDCAELLVSVAVSAARSGVWEIFKKTLDIATALVVEKGLPLTAIQRIYRRQIDLALFSCGRDDTFRDLGSILSYVEELSNRFTKLLEQDQSPENYNACIKIRAAAGEVLTLQNELDNALKAFRSAERLELELVALKSDPRQRWHRSPLAGQAARRYAWLLWELASRTEDHQKREPLVQHMRDLQDMNMPRLQRHSGEWPALLLGEASIAMLENNWVRAEKLLLDKFSERSHLAGTTLASRLYVDSLGARIALNLLTHARQCPRLRQTELRRRATVLIERLLRITHKDAQDFPLYHADAQLLGAKFIVQHQGSLDRGIKDVQLGPAHMLAVANEIVTETGYLLRWEEIRQLKAQSAG